MPQQQIDINQLNQANVTLTQLYFHKQLKNLPLIQLWYKKPSNKLLKKLPKPNLP
ncbi:hypothetical protein [Peribacillus sp. AS_2]|uniref:hypothetical protein n=1 Tax=Peribacillus sp. AS_2 TaxID=2996755 RepID=UPI0022A7A6ED|nr:hypothetical protein [Peribacillus sp. AS_2]MCZ0873132.1 hypothetical protein [Peribacillus sp. AS_2]